MEQKPILFLHGFASSARSTKAHYFRQKLQGLPQIEYHAIEFNPTPVDFQYVTTTGLVDRMRQFVLDHNLETIRIIGSSFGGLVATHYARRFGDVERMLLLAPGLRWLSGGLSEGQLEAWKAAGALPVYHKGFRKEVSVRYELHVDGMQYLTPIQPPSAMIIIHGRNDSTVLINDSRAYAAEHPAAVQLVEVEADHDLNGHLDLAWGHVQSFLLSA